MYYPHIGGYHVHAAKLRRQGVPIYTSHSIQEVYGENCVEGAIVVQLDEQLRTIEGTQEDIECDTVCLAVGLTPSTRLLFQAPVVHQYVPEAGGHVAIHTATMQTSITGVYVAGDASGIEEASTAMVEGKIAGLSAAMELRPHLEAEEQLNAYQTMLQAMREGPFGRKAQTAKEKIRQEASHEGL